MTKKYRRLLIIALAIGLFVFIVPLFRVTPAAVWQEAQKVNGYWLIVALSCMLMHWAIEGKIIQGLLRREAANFSFKNALRIPLIEHLFNAITPFSTGGQPAQLLTLVKSGIDPGVSGSVCMMKFVVYQVMIVLNFIGCLIFGFSLLKQEFQHLSYLVLLGFIINLIVVVTLLMIMYHYTFTNKVVTLFLKIFEKVVGEEKATHWKNVLTEKMTNFYQESRYMKQEKKMMFRTFVLTFFQLICYYIVPYFILLSMGVKQINIWQIIIFHAFIILIISLFPIPGGTGGAEYSFTLLFGGFIASPSQLLLAIFLWRLITHYSGVFLGLIALFIKPDTLETSGTTL